MFKRKFKILLSITIGLLSLAGIMFANCQKMFAEDKDNPDNSDIIQPTCYYTAPPADRVFPSPLLIKEQEALETLYKEGKINKETYETRKAKIEDQIRSLNDKKESDN